MKTRQDQRGAEGSPTFEPENNASIRTAVPESPAFPKVKIQRTRLIRSASATPAIFFLRVEGFGPYPLELPDSPILKTTRFFSDR